VNGDPGLSRPPARRPVQRLPTFRAKMACVKTYQTVTGADRLTPYHLFMLALCLFALSLIGAEVLVPMDDATRTILQYADLAICVLFLADFVGTFARAENKTRYMLTWGWIDLLSSIPAIDALRLGRAARLLRILRLLRAVRSLHVLGEFVMTQRAQSTGLAAALLALLLVIFSSVAVLQFEVPAGGNIRSAEDAVWWSITTMTTVGYGDRYPVTTGGRAIAMVLMVAGVGVVGVLSGLMAGWFLSAGAADDEEREELKALIGQLREQLANKQEA
jgi:voltage-gated potassium channel